MGNFVNLIDEKINGDDFHNIDGMNIISELGENNFYVSNLLSEGELKSFNGILENCHWTPVGYSGMQGNYNDGDPIGSYRATIYDEEYAKILWNRLISYLPNIREFDNKSHSDWDNHPMWKPIGVSPVFRAIKYTNGGKLIVHYDAPFIESERKRTLQSLVIYVKNENIIGGSTRFINDPQNNIDFDKRIFNDQNRFASEEEVIYSPPKNDGGAIIFDHRNLHDGQIVQGQGEKIIIRTDIFYEKVDE